MDVSGRPREGWMIFLPLTVLLSVVVHVVGGPEALLVLVQQWSEDLAGAVRSWVHYL